MKIKWFIFNYAHFDHALQLFYGFLEENCDVYLLNCASPNDPPFDETDRIKKFPNIYYSGQWNEALKLLDPDTDVMFITNADVDIPSISKLIHKTKSFYSNYGDKAGVYAPNVWWTPWTFNPALLKDLGNGLREVMGTDSTIWSLSASLAHQVGPIDLSINKLGWGIELVAAYYASMQEKLVVRDYTIKCGHPRNTSYDRNAADREWRNMISKMKLDHNFWKFYDTRNKYGFGWVGKDEIITPSKLFL